MEVDPLFGKERGVRRKMVFREAIVRKDEEAEVSTPSLDEVPGGTEETEGKEIEVWLTAESRENMKKRALVALEVPGFSPFSMWSDEGTSMGGDDSAPAPLAYFSAAIAF
jgi:hypothetical protein